MGIKNKKIIKISKNNNIEQLYKMEFSTFNSDSSSLQPQLQSQQSQESQIQPTIGQKQNQKPLSFHEKIHDFLLSKSGTIITSSFGMAIGFALKDFIDSIVVNLFKPLLVFIFTTTHLNNYYDLNSIISPENNVLNFGSFVTAFITFILVIISVYFIHLIFQ